MKKDWTYKKLEDCIESVKYTTKIQSKDYMASGEYPIISQEEELVSGYWNKNKDVFSAPRPLVVFGDHTRVLKYIDFDFVLGADGVKILLPVEDLEAKFLYYFLKWYNVPSLGYSRHYKLLKEISIPIPPLSIQRSIVAELDLLHSVIEKKQEQLRALDNLAQSLFYQMFGDPITNPMGWQVKKLGEVCGLKAGKSIKAVELQDYCEGLYPCYGGNGIRGYIGKYSHTENHSIIGRQGALCGNINYAIAPFYATEHAVVVTPLISMNDVWLFYSLMNLKLEQYAHGVAQPGLSVQDLVPISLPLPPLSLQQSFAAKVSAIEEQKRFISQSIKDVESLLAQRMDQYFSSLPVSVLPPVVHDGSK